jgi:SAM-dependent methyltransferase
VGGVTAEYFDAWYTDIAASPARQQLFTDHLGLPAEVGPSNHVPLIGLQSIASALEVSAGEVIVDLACGRGGPGMWIARELGAKLIGVDFSAEAIRQATERRALFGLESTATFTVGSLEATGLADASADAVICIDAFQFASDTVAAAVEIRRILRPGRRVVLTSWEAVEPGDELLGPRIRNLDLVGALTAAGFADVRSSEPADWHEAARGMWEAAMALEAGGDPAIVSMQTEGERSLATHDRMRRVMATATVRGEPIRRTVGSG